MKRHIIGILFIVGLLIGCAMLLYPTVSGRINTNSQSRIVAHYLDDVTKQDDASAQALLEAAQAYNRQLLVKEGRFKFSPEETARYHNLLDTGRSIMGVLVIDKISVELPIYHGTSEEVLQVGLGHMPGTSLPVGGTGTHAFITGHRGLPSSTLLSGLNLLAEGDAFVLYVMGETLTYQVDLIQIVEPYRVEAVGIDMDRDYCTLLTCTPYGVNSHRLLVRGHRIETAPGEKWETLFADAKRLDKLRTMMIFMIPVLMVMMVCIIVKCRKIRKGGITW